VRNFVAVTELFCATAQKNTLYHIAWLSMYLRSRKIRHKKSLQKFNGTNYWLSCFPNGDAFTPPKPKEEKKKKRGQAPKRNRPMPRHFFDFRERWFTVKSSLTKTQTKIFLFMIECEIALLFQRVPFFQRILYQSVSLEHIKPQMSPVASPEDDENDIDGEDDNADGTYVSYLS
jgi:hypothetical protein